MNRLKRTISIIVTMIIVLSVNAQNWTQYLGSNRNSISDQKNILKTWPANGPQVLWTTNVGIGFGGPVVKDGKAYLLDRDDNTGDKLRCFEMSSGKELWSYGYDAPGSVMFPGSRSVPTIDGNYIYTVGPYGHINCIDLNSHKPVWTKNIWTDYGGERIPNWAITQCPLIYGDLVIVASQAPKAGVVAYDKRNGNVKWTTLSIGGVGYVSPSILKVGNESHIVMISASQGRGPDASGGKVVGIDPITGKIIWEYTNWQCSIPVPSAVDAGEGRALISGGYNAGTSFIKIAKKSDGTYSVTELFKTIEFGTHTQPPVLVNGHFYGMYSTNERKDGLVCLGMDGKVKWKTMRKPLFDKGGMIVADGVIISTDGASDLYLIQPDPSAFKPIATATVLAAGSGDSRNPNQNWAPIAIADGKLLIRDQGKLVCVKIVK